MAYFVCRPAPSLSMRKGSEMRKSLACLREVEMMPWIVLLGVSPLKNNLINGQ